MTEEQGIPEGRCGFELTPKEADIDWEGDLMEWRNSIKAVCCWRKPWREFERCIWHARDEAKPVEGLKAACADIPERIYGAYLVGVNASDELSFQGYVLLFADFSGANFSGANFERCQLRGADFTDVDFPQARFAYADLFKTHFPEAYLRGAQFHDANLQHVQFHNADLGYALFPAAELDKADLYNAYAQHAYFGGANLQEADLTRADLRSATLINGHFDQVVFSNTRINSNTDFGDSPDNWGPTCVYESHPEATNPPDDRDSLEAAEWFYRRLQKLHEENALSEEARGFHVRKEEARRQYHKKQATTADDSGTRKQSRTEFFVSSLNWHLTRHGESLSQILRVAGLVIILSASLFPLSGFSSNANNMSYYYPISTWLQVDTLDKAVSALSQTIGTFLQSLYFSVITFTTIGYGDLYPIGTVSKVLVGFESLAGAILIALFIFVLGRRVAQ